MQKGTIEFDDFLLSFQLIWMDGLWGKIDLGGDWKFDALGGICGFLMDLEEQGRWNMHIFLLIIWRIKEFNRISIFNCYWRKICLSWFLYLFLNLFNIIALLSGHQWKALHPFFNLNLYQVSSRGEFWLITSLVQNWTWLVIIFIEISDKPVQNSD